jgi:hypothetical protein
VQHLLRGGDHLAQHGREVEGRRERLRHVEDRLEVPSRQRAVLDGRLHARAM